MRFAYPVSEETQTRCAKALISLLVEQTGKIRKDGVLLLDADGEPYAAIQNKGIICSTSRMANGNLWFTFASQLTHNQLGLAGLPYSRICEVGEYIAQKYLTKQS